MGEGEGSEDNRHRDRARDLNVLSAQGFGVSFRRLDGVFQNSKWVFVKGRDDKGCPGLELLRWCQRISTAQDFSFHARHSACNSTSWLSLAPTYCAISSWLAMLLLVIFFFSGEYSLPFSVWRIFILFLALKNPHLKASSLSFQSSSCLSLGVSPDCIDWRGCILTLSKCSQPQLAKVKRARTPCISESPPSAQTFSRPH